MSDTPDGRELPTEYAFVVDPGFASRAARALTGQTLLRPPWTLIPPLAGVLVICLVLVSGPDSPIIWLPVGLIAIEIIMVPAFYLTARKQIDTTLPSGARITVRYFDRSLTMSTPTVTSEMAHSIFDRVRVRGDVVLFRMRNTSTYSLAPKQLLPDAELDRIRPLIERPAPPPPDPASRLY